MRDLNLVDLVQYLSNTTIETIEKQGKEIREELSIGADTHYLVMIGLLCVVVILLLLGNIILLMSYLNKSKVPEKVIFFMVY